MQSRKAKVWLVGAAVLTIVQAPMWGQVKTLVYIVPSRGMEPTIHEGDRVWVQRTPYQKGNPKRGDICLTNLPNSLTTPGFSNPSAKILFVKRIVGVPGDRIEMVNGRLKLDGVWQKEPFAHWDGRYFYSLKVVGNKVYSRDIGGDWACQNVLVQDQAKIDKVASTPIPARKYLIFGDNRGNSNDSHIFGLVDRGTIQARVAGRIWPNPRDF